MKSQPPRKSTKSMGKAKNKGAAAVAPPKCTCDHPFQCSCGNRPERPSKGHKWYPEDQVWAGKGHKQKGASGQTASVSEQAKITEKGKTQVEQWQRLPSQLLQEFCGRQQRHPPEYTNIGKEGAFKYRVIVRDTKDSDKDLFFVPSHAVCNEEQAKEEGALLALLQLTPTLPHERKLPDPYKTTWLNAIENQKNASTTKSKKDVPVNKKSSDSSKGESSEKESAMKVNEENDRKIVTDGAVASSNLTLGTTYISNAAKRQQIDEKRRLQNARIRKHAAFRMANQNHPVFMSATIRKQIESLLRGESASRHMLDLENGSDNEKEDDPASGEEGDAKVYVVDRLHSEGFTKRQARAAFDESVRINATVQDDDEALWDKLYEECLQWLLVHMNEDQLPEGFDPRGRTLDVVVPASATKCKTRSCDSAPDGGVGSDASSIAFADRYGITVREATLIAALAIKQEKSPLDVFWQAIRVAADVCKDGVSISKSDAGDEMRELAIDELEALLAIFDSGCSVSKVEDNASLVRVVFDDVAMFLEVLVQDGVYPGVRPKRVTVGGKWLLQLGAALHVELARFVEGLPLGEPMIFAIHARVQDILQSDVLTELSLMPHIGTDDFAAKPEPTDTATCGKLKQEGASDSNLEPAPKSAEPRRRPRDKRKTFWSIHPRDVSPAISCPKVSISMERARKSLPAATSRVEFLAAMKTAEQQGSRVVLVTGETGSGESKQSSSSPILTIEITGLTNVHCIYPQASRRNSLPIS